MAIAQIAVKNYVETEVKNIVLNVGLTEIDKL
jgi:hypothetical protein